MPSITNQERYRVLAHIFERVDGLSEHQQILLLKGLKKDLLRAHLLKLIIDLNEVEQDQLLNQLKEMAAT